MIIFSFHIIIDARATNVSGVDGGGPVFLSEVECTGSEEKLILCPSVGIGNHTCSQLNTAGVICGNSESKRCTYVS